MCSNSYISKKFSHPDPGMIRPIPLIIKPSAGDGYVPDAHTNRDTSTQISRSERMRGGAGPVLSLNAGPVTGLVPDRSSSAGPDDIEEHEQFGSSAFISRTRTIVPGKHANARLFTRPWGCSGSAQYLTVFRIALLTG